MFVVFILGSALGVALLGREIHPEGTLPPGTRIAGAPVGGMPIEDARTRLERHLAKHISEPVLITYQDRTWTPSADDLGARFDIDRSIGDALGTESRADRMRTRLFGVQPKDFPLYINFEQDALESYVASIAAEIDRDPSIPDLAVDNGHLVLSPPVSGLEVQQEQVVQQIRNGVGSLQILAIELPVDEIEVEFTPADVEAVDRLLNQALSGPVTIVFEDRAWRIEPVTIAELVSLHLDPDANEGERVSLDLSSDQLLSHVYSMIGDVNRPAINASIAWGGSSVVALTASQTGVEVDVAATLPSVESAIFSGERTVELVAHYVRPAIDSNNLGELGITGLVASGQSYFWNSSPSRAHNIGVAASYINGTVIPPGAEFSFNQAVGPITPERGYQEGYVILAEETVPGVGGGVCQVSTTVFRAAFFAGVPITERHPHAYIVGFYEAGGWPLGFDAAIFQPHSDLRFVNNTGSYMILHSYVVDDQLFVNLYGANNGWEVTLGDPVFANRVDPPSDVEVLDTSLPAGARQQVEWAKPGVDVTLTRTVRKNGEVIREDYFFSSFQPWGNRFLVGPAVPQAPAPAAEENTEPEPEETPSSAEDDD
jgi:vancomycin resistance protein YoaR